MLKVASSLSALSAAVVQRCSNVRSDVNVHRRSRGCLQDVSNCSSAHEGAALVRTALQKGPILDAVMAHLSTKDIRRLAGVMNDRQIHALAQPRHDALVEVLDGLEALAGDLGNPQFCRLSEALIGWIDGGVLLGRSIAQAQADRAAVEHALDSHEQAAADILAQCSPWVRSHEQTKASVLRLEHSRQFLRALLLWSGPRHDPAADGLGEVVIRAPACWLEVAHLLSDQPASWRGQLLRAYCAMSSESLETYLPALRQYSAAERVSLLRVLLASCPTDLEGLDALVKEAQMLPPLQRSLLASELCWRSWEFFGGASILGISKLNALTQLVLSAGAWDKECHSLLFCNLEQMVLLWVWLRAEGFVQQAPIESECLSFAANLGRIACRYPCSDRDYRQEMRSVAVRLWPGAPKRQVAFESAYARGMSGKSYPRVPLSKKIRAVFNRFWPG